jgi:hypothetical protein
VNDVLRKAVTKAVEQGTKLGDEALIKIGREAVKFIAKYDATLAQGKEACERLAHTQKPGNDTEENRRNVISAMAKSNVMHDELQVELARLQLTVQLLTEGL